MSVPGGDTALTDGLLVERLSVSYRERAKRKVVLEGLDLSVERGRFTTIVGPSGCGKTTLLKAVCGLVTPDGGNVSIFGESVGRARERKHLGLVPQSLALLPWRSVRANVELSLELHGGERLSEGQKRRVVDVLSSFGLGAVLDKHPHELSGGMRQRVAIARAFVHEPQLLLLDEPFSALDEVTAETLRDELVAFSAARGTTVLFVTHSVPEAVALSDMIVVMAPPPRGIVATVHVDLPRPRHGLVELDDAFVRLTHTIRDELRQASSESVLK